MFLFGKPRSAWAPPLLIAGTGGSGTRVFTLLARDLGYFMGAHVNEFQDAQDTAAFIARWQDRLLPGQPPCTPREQKTMQRDFDSALRRHRSGIPRAEAAWGYKNPRAIFLLPTLMDLFPGTSFLHVVRDGLDMAFSDNQGQLDAFGAAWLDPASEGLPRPMRSALLWARVNAKAADLGESKLGPRYLRIRFEDLCAEPDRCLSQLEAFTTRRFEGLRPQALGRIQAPLSLGRGRRQDPALGAQVLAACGDARLRFGYVPPAAD